MISRLASHRNCSVTHKKLNYVSVKARKGSAEYLCQDTPTDWFKTLARPEISLGWSHAAITFATQIAQTPLNSTTCRF